MLGQAGHRRIIEMVETRRVGHQPHQSLIEISLVADPRRHRGLEIQRTALACSDRRCAPGQRIAQEAAAANLAG
jgi:hypothetical protein